ncbi:MAG TPA: MFS transporter, partial [Bryobacteraceae bacterium]|nr:MFS transporter [Bryobacteraceae bacterium]
ATFGVAVAAPFAGQIADRLGRKPVIVWSAALLGITTLLAASSPNLTWLIFWRFLQGLATPGVFAVTVAYINDEWPPERAASAAGAYVSGTVIGGFSGRAISGVASEFIGWRWGFVIVGLMSVAIAVTLARMLPPERNFVRGSHASLLRPALAHLRNRQLFATYSAGFCVLFTIIALFTYATFHLAAPPYSLSPAQLGGIFTVYLVGAAITPSAGRAIDRYGHRKAVLIASVMCTTGALVSLYPSVWAVLLGLTLGSSGVFVSQSAAVSYIGTVASHARALAVGLYVTFYYIGGSFGSTGPAWLWDAWKWPGCVALIICVQMVLASIVWFSWRAVPERVSAPLR